MEHNQLQPEEIAEEYSLHPSLAQVICQRGINTEEKINTYFLGQLDDLHPPAAIPNIDWVTEVIRDAASRGKEIVIFTDYDVDGITGAVILYRSIQSLFPEASLDLHLSSRFVEGYGLTRDSIDSLNQQGAELIITVDCGINDLEEIAYAEELGIEVVVIDHHQAEVKPEFPFVNLRVYSGDYPFLDLCGCAMVWKTAQHLLQDNLYSFLDLVALATIADLVDLKDENRIIVRKGLELINEGNCNQGLGTLLRLKGIKAGDVTSEIIAYQIAPMINASGRLGSADKSLELLLTEEDQRRKILAVALNQLNLRRRKKTEQALKLVKESIDTSQGIIVYKGQVETGIMGLVAANLREIYSKPAVIIGKNNRGSCRSIQPLNMYLLLKECSEYLHSYGGHKMAAGLTIKKGKYKELCQRLYHSTSALEYEAQQPDLELRVEELNMDLINDLERMTPFGKGNNPPVFHLRSISCHNLILLANKHLQFQINGFQAIGYNMREHFELCQREKVDLLLRPELNQQERSGRLVIEDIYASEGCRGGDSGSKFDNYITG